MHDQYEKIYRAGRFEWTAKPIAELTAEELRAEREKLPGYAEWYEREVREYYALLDSLELTPPG
jgi:hypothetical protein